MDQSGATNRFNELQLLHGTALVHDEVAVRCIRLLSVLLMQHFFPINPCRNAALPGNFKLHGV